MKSKVLNKLVGRLLCIVITLPLVSWGQGNNDNNTIEQGTFTLPQGSTIKQSASSPAQDSIVKQVDTLLHHETLKTKRARTIIVDAGHGGQATGARGSFSLEKDVTLALALQLKQAIERDIKHIHVVMTRTSDIDVELHKRAAIANKHKGDLFISIHCNSLRDIRKTVKVGYKIYKKGKSKKRIPVYKTVCIPNRSGKGVLLLVYGLHRTEEQMEALRENAEIFQEANYQENYGGYDPNDPASFIVLNAFKNIYRRQSIRFANLLLHEFVDIDRRLSAGGVKEQGVLVLARSGMPAVLVEVGFINNFAEEQYLNSEKGQAEIVRSLVRAIKRYFNEP